MVVFRNHQPRLKDWVVLMDALARPSSLHNPLPNPSNWGQIHQARTGHCQPLSTAEQASSSSAAFSKCWSHKSGHHSCNIGSPKWCPHYRSQCQKREQQNKLWSYLCNSASKQPHDPTSLSLHPLSTNGWVTPN